MTNLKEQSLRHLAHACASAHQVLELGVLMHMPCHHRCRDTYGPRRSEVGGTQAV